MTAGERLRALAGVGGTAGALLLLIGSGATAGAALVDYSGLPTGTAAVHLMTDVTTAEVAGGDDAPDWTNKKVNDLRMKMIKDDEFMLELIMSAVTRGLLH